jgi:hypothetical protein
VITAKMLPGLFFGHRSPMDAVTETATRSHSRTSEKKMPRPKAILRTSADWYVPDASVWCRRNRSSISGLAVAMRLLDRQPTNRCQYAAGCFRSWRHVRFRAQRRNRGGQAQARFVRRSGSIFRGGQFGWHRPRRDDWGASARSHQRLAIYCRLDACRAHYVLLVSNHQSAA